MHYSTPSPHAVPSSSSSSSPSSVSSLGFLGTRQLNPSCVSINLEELMYILVGDFELTFYQQGHRVTCGTLDRTDSDGCYSPGGLSPETISLAGRPNMAVHHEEEDMTAFSSSRHNSGEEASPGDPCLTSEPPSTGPSPTKPSLHSQSPSRLPSRIIKTQEERVRRNAARKRFVLDALAFDMNSSAMACFNEIWMLLMLNTQIDCKALTIASIATLRPKRRATQPYGSERPPWWPKVVRFLDPSHLVLHERHTVLFYLWLNPTHSESDILKIPRVAAVKKRYQSDQLERIFNLVIMMRNTMRHRN